MSEIVCTKEKRQRGKHFFKAELVFLCELVEKNITIIRSKQGRVSKKRLVEQIKDKWRKSCSTAKLEAAVNRKSLNQTGGGPALPTPREVTQKIIELHTDALKTYQKRKGIILYIFSVLSEKLDKSFYPVDKI